MSRYVLFGIGHVYTRVAIAIHLIQYPWTDCGRATLHKQWFIPLECESTFKFVCDLKDEGPS